MRRLGAMIAWVGVGLALSGLFWDGLWRGQGLIGGDLYTYFFPQKVYYADRLNAGEFPLWNNRVGHGYPLVAESQTGVFYPPNLLAYQWLDVNSAYNAVQLFHYVIAFVFCVALGRALKFSALASALVGIVFVYGWFPARLSLEWAILTGAWMPAALWCTEKLLCTGKWRFAGGLALVTALQMLPGHFHLAFITQVLVVTYAAGRVWFTRPDVEGESEAATKPAGKWWRLAGVLPALLLGFGLAAIQLVPTWELKTLSQRSAVGTYYDPAYGHLPIQYWTQIVAPFLWYGTGTDLNTVLPAGSPPTNVVEAHLYFGLVPVGLMLYGLFTGVYWRNRVWLLWVGLGILALVYATGWLLPMTKSIPGFHFFRGVGRWGVVTTMAAALLSGAALDRWCSRRRSRWIAAVFAGVLIVLTVIDLRIVRGLVGGGPRSFTEALASPNAGDAVFVDHPPIAEIEHSPIREQLLAFPKPVRLFCRGQNLPTLLGVASTPVYLGIGPDEYFDPQTSMPEPWPFDEPATPAQIDWLQRAGVTHVLSFSALDERVWPVEYLWSGFDPFLFRAWARRPGEPLFLYELRGTRGRVSWEEPDLRETPPAVRELSANRVVIETRSTKPGTLILTDLAYPGWHVKVDGEPRDWRRFEGMYRSLELTPGEHTVEWIYNPSSQRWGFWITGGSCLLLIGIVLLRLRLAKKSDAPKKMQQ